MTRGIVLGLTQLQIAARARYLGQLTTSAGLDAYVNGGRPVASKCVDGYYLLEHEHGERNGGQDPTASDPFYRWSKDGSTFTNRTADCVAGAAWCGGWDRVQKRRFAHIYDGDINVNSMLLDAFGPAKCFVALERPEPGCFVVAPTGARGFERCGHIATVYAVPPEWDPEVADCWRHVLAVDVAHRDPHPANRPTSAIGWFAGRGHDAQHTAFVRCVMQP